MLNHSHKSNRLIGWTYESDTTAISEAQEKLESLNIDRQQEILQYQIDQYEVQKEILENLDSKKQEEAYKNALDAWAEESGVNKNGLGNLTSAIVYAASNGKIKYNPSTDGDFNNYINQQKEAVNTKMTNIKTASDKFLTNNNGVLSLSDENLSVEDYNRYHSALETAVNEAREAGATKNQLKIYQDWLDENPEREVVANIKNKNNLRTNNVSVEGIGRGISDWGNDDITISIGNKEYHVTTSDWDSVNGNQDELNDNFGPYTPVRGDIQKYKNKYYVYNGDKWERIVESHDMNLFENMFGIKNSGDELQKLFDDLDSNAIKQNAQGTLSFQGGPSLINELGTEGLITPEGTYTALPSKTGIVPADLTKNVWQLGEVAPTLIAQLRSITQGAPTGTPGNTTYEEGQYFDNFTMNVYPTENYDMDKLLMEARAKMRLTRHNN